MTPMTPIEDRTGPGLEARLAELGLTVRPFRDLADYAPMAALMGRAHAVHGIPWLPTEENLRIETEGADGLVPGADIVLVEGPSGLVAFAMVERVVRDDVPDYDLWGYVDPDHRRRGIATALFGHNLERIATRVAVEDARFDGPAQCARRGERGRPHRPPRARRIRAGPALLPHASHRARRCPGAAPARGLGAQAR